MRKKIAVTGAVILAAGLVMLFASSSVVNAHTSEYSKMYQKGTDEWVSIEINSTSNTDIAITMSSNISVGLVPASNLSAVTSSNIQQYALSPSQSTNTSSTFIISYLHEPGKFYIVASSPSHPVVHYTVINDASAVSVLSLFTLFGIMVGIAGVIVTGLGAILKNKKNDPE